MCLGDVLTSTGEEVSRHVHLVQWTRCVAKPFLLSLIQDEAFEVYSKVVSSALISK